MKLDLPVPVLNVICQALQCLQQQTAVALEQINAQAAAQLPDGRDPLGQKGDSEVRQPDQEQRPVDGPVDG
jgi:hypothetical protein